MLIRWIQYKAHWALQPWVFSGNIKLRLWRKIVQRRYTVHDDCDSKHVPKKFFFLMTYLVRFRLKTSTHLKYTLPSHMDIKVFTLESLLYKRCLVCCSYLYSISGWLSALTSLTFDPVSFDPLLSVWRWFSFWLCFRVSAHFRKFHHRVAASND